MPAPSSTTATQSIKPAQPTPEPAQQATLPAQPALPDARSQRSRRQGRGDGQWALGYREPLNKNEELKKNDDGLNVRDRIVNVYAKRGFDSIDPRSEEHTSELQ